MTQQVSPIPYPNYNAHYNAKHAYAGREHKHFEVEYISTSRQPSALELALSERHIENQSCIDDLMMLNQQLTPRAAASRDAAQRTRLLIRQAMLVKKTETTRLKKFEIRGGQFSVEALKSKEEIEIETDAQKRAASMLSDTLYRFNVNAGFAGFSPRDVVNNRRSMWTKLAPIV